MALVELFVAVVIAGVSCVNAAMPGAAWGRSHDGRFVALAAANAALALLGGLWTWGQLPVSAPSWTGTPLVPEMCVLGAAVLFLASTLVPRHA